MSKATVCDRHGLIKRHLVCLTGQNRNRLLCMQCHSEQDENAVINEIINANRNEVRVLFNQVMHHVDQQVNNGDQFMKMLDQNIVKLKSDKRQNIQIMSEYMVNDSYRLIDQLRNEVNDRIVNEHHQRIQQIQNDIIAQNRNQQINDIEDRLTQMQRQQEQMMQMMQQMQQQQNLMQPMINKSKNNLQNAIELSECKQYVDIIDNKLSKYRNEISQYEKNNQKYHIKVDFWDIDSSLEHKMKVIEMINQMNVNHKVGNIAIKLSNSNPINEQIVRMIMNNYSNPFIIQIRYDNEQVDSNIHNVIKQLVQQSTIIKFRICCYYGGELFRSDEGMNLIKEYNQIIKQNQNIKWLWYYHTKINKYVESRQGVIELIDQVDRM